MGVGFTGFCLHSVFSILFTLFFKDAYCQVYSWSVSVHLNISVCSNSLSNPLTLNWTYNPPTPHPPLIEWSKVGSGSTVNAIATYAGGKFIPSVAYTGRVTRTGSTAEIAIQGPLTAADEGAYQVSVTSSAGVNLDGFANLIFPVVSEPINGSCVETATASYTVTCTVDVAPPVTLQLKKGSDFVDSASSDSGLSQTVSSAGTYQCSVTGQGSECVTPNSKEVICTPDNSTPTPSGPTTSPSPSDGMCKDNDLCYLFFLLFIPPLILIGVLVWYRSRKKKDVESDQGDETKMDETKMDKTKMDKTKMDKTKIDETKMMDETKMDKTKMDKTKMDETKPNFSAVQQRL